MSKRRDNIKRTFFHFEMELEMSKRRDAAIDKSIAAQRTLASQPHSAAKTTSCSGCCNSSAVKYLRYFSRRHVDNFAQAYPQY